MYRYIESGLDNVFLEDGYTVHKTKYGKGVSIQNTEGLHRAIGKWVIGQPCPLKGAELRFLRLEMEQTQRDLAAILGTTEQSLRLWEKNRNKALPGPADRLLRALYADYRFGDGHVRRMLERLAALDQQDRPQVRFHESKRGGWKPRTAPALEEAMA